jgi:hypothetical protein
VQNILRNAEPFRVTAEHLQQIEAATGLVMSNRPEQLAPADFIGLMRALRQLGYPVSEAA